MNTCQYMIYDKDYVQKFNHYGGHRQTGGLKPCGKEAFQNFTTKGTLFLCPECGEFYEDCQKKPVRGKFLRMVTIKTNRGDFESPLYKEFFLFGEKFGITNCLSDEKSFVLTHLGTTLKACPTEFKTVKIAMEEGLAFLKEKGETVIKSVLEKAGWKGEETFLIL